MRRGIYGAAAIVPIAAFIRLYNARLTTKLTYAQARRLNTFFRAGKRDGWWDKLITFYPFSLVNHADDFLINMISTTAPLTQVGSGTREIGVGWVGDGTTGYLSLGTTYDNVVGGLNNFEIGIFSVSDVSASGERDFGATSGAEIFAVGKGAGNIMALAAASPANIVANVVDSLGMYGMSRNNASTFLARKNGITLQEVTDPSSGPSTNFPAGNATIGRSVGTSFSTRQFALFYTGEAMTDFEYEEFYFAVRKLMYDNGVTIEGMIYTNESLETRAPLAYKQRADGLTTKMRDTDGPLVMIMQTGNSRSVGSQKALTPVVTTTVPPTASLYSGMMFNAASLGAGVRGRGNNVLGADELTDFEAAYEQEYTGTSLGETNGSACLEWLCEKLDDAEEDPVVFLWRTHGAAGKQLIEVSSGTQPYENALLEARYARYLARIYEFPSPYIQYHSVTVVNGDQDRTAATPRATFESQLNTLVADYNTDLPAINGQTEDILLLIIQLSGQCSTTSRSGSEVSLAQLDFTRNNSLGRMIAPAYILEHDSGDALHYSPAGYHTMGQYQAAAIRSEMAGTEWAALGQFITVTRASNVITVKFWRNRAKTTAWNNLQFKTTDPLLEVHPGGFYGIAYTDDTTSATISSVAIVSNGGTNNALQVTLNITPTGTNKYLEVAYNGPGTLASHSACWSNLCDDATDPGPNYCVILRESV